MRSRNSYRPQNQNPDGLRAYQQGLAERNMKQVRVTVQAMLQRKTPSRDITVAAVAKESGVSLATIYRRQKLFTLIQHANPTIQRRQTEQVHQQAIQQLREEKEKAQADAAYHQQLARATQSGGQKSQKEIVQYKKTIVALQRQVAELKEQLAIQDGPSARPLILPLDHRE